MRHKVPPPPKSLKNKTKLAILYKFFSQHYSDMPLLLADLALFFSKHNITIAKDIIEQAKIHFPYRPKVIDTHKKVFEKANNYNSSEQQQLFLIRDTYRRLHAAGLPVKKIDQLFDRKAEVFKTKINDKFSNINWRCLDKYLDSYNEAETNNTKEMSISFPSNNEVLLIEIESSILRKKGFSFVRFGDGEGTLLNESFSSSITNDLKQMLKTWWGKDSFDKKALKHIQSNLLETYNGADVIGIPNLQQQLSDFSIEENRFTRAYAKLNLLASKNINKTYVSAYANHSLLKSNEFDKLIKNSTIKICIISGHPEALLTAHFERQYKINIANYISIPSEYKFVSQFGYTIQEAHFPIVYERICKILSEQSLKGKLFLIGAGVLGKYYCHLVKQQGGIALDVGSIFDYMLGHNTRKFFNVTEYKKRSD